MRHYQLIFVFFFLFLSLFGICFCTCTHAVCEVHCDHASWCAKHISIIIIRDVSLKTTTAAKKHLAKHVLDATFGRLFKEAFDLIAGSIIIVINLHPFSWSWMLCVFQFWTACDYIFHIFNKTNFVYMRMFSVSFCARTCVRLCCEF